MKKFTLYIVLISCSLLISACSGSSGDSSVGKTPLLSLRLRQTSTESETKWRDTYQAISENQGCCDEVWFATGITIPPLDFHREHAEILSKAKQDLEQQNIATALQIQMTIGHGDQLIEGIEKLFSNKTWGGWTGSTGVEAKYCNCPRQPEFLAYMQEMAAIYAPLRFRTIWIDDDLRYENHKPATDGSLLGCWCETCIEAFNSEHNTKYTRETLSRAVASDDVVAEQWWVFSVASLQNVARVIAIEFLKVSPDTQLGLQHTSYDGHSRYQDAIIKTLTELNGKPALFRPGGGDYYDSTNAAGQISKSMQSARHMVSMDNTNIQAWCPEIESWPRVYGSRTARSIQAEGFAALAYGADAISYFVVAGEKEDASVYSYSLLKPISEASNVLYKYKEANEGTRPVGYKVDVYTPELYEFGCSAMPVLPGEGKSLGELSSQDIVFNYTVETSKEIQARRQAIDDKCHTPVLCLSPYIGLVIPRVNDVGNVRTIAIINTRIDSQYKVKLRIDGYVKNAVWYEMRNKPVKLLITQDGDYSYVEIPEIDAWNCGFIDLL